MVRGLPPYDTEIIDNNLVVMGDTTTKGDVINIGNVGVGTTAMPTSPLLTSTLYIYNPDLNEKSLYINSTHNDPNYIIGDGSFVIDKGGAVGIGTTITDTYGLNIYNGVFLMTDGFMNVDYSAGTFRTNGGISIATAKPSQHLELAFRNYMASPTTNYLQRLDGSDNYMKYNITRTPTTGHLFQVNGSSRLKVEDTSTTINVSGTDKLKVESGITTVSTNIKVQNSEIQAKVLKGEEVYHQTDKTLTITNGGFQACFRMNGFGGVLIPQHGMYAWTMKFYNTSDVLQANIYACGNLYWDAVNLQIKALGNIMKTANITITIDPIGDALIITNNSGISIYGVCSLTALSATNRTTDDLSFYS